MTAILLPIDPKWCALMMNGKKKVEVRKGNVSKAVQKLIDKYGFADIYGYCTKNGGNLLQMDIIDDNVYAKLEKDCDNEDLENSCDILNGKVIFKFRCYKVEEIRFYDKEVQRKACLTEDELFDYLFVNEPYHEDMKNGYAIHISELEIFDKPKELSEFRHSHCDNFIKNVKVVLNAFDDYVFQYFDNERCCKCKHYDSDSNDCLKSFKPLIKAPQSFCYIEVSQW